jgi:hypothetical protein
MILLETFFILNLIIFYNMKNELYLTKKINIFILVQIIIFLIL